MQIIEFTGLPGSGKTTFFRPVKQALSQQGLNVADAKDLIVQFSHRKIPLLNIIHPVLSEKIAKRWFDSRNFRSVFFKRFIQAHSDLLHLVVAINSYRPIPSNHKQEILTWFLETGGIYELYSNMDKDVTLILDEGFFHKIINLFVSLQEDTYDSVLLDKYLDSIPPIDTLIHIHTDKDICLKRMQKREQYGRMGSTPEEQMVFLTRASGIIESGIQMLADKKTSVITIDNNNHMNILEREEIIHRTLEIRSEVFSNENHNKCP